MTRNGTHCARRVPLEERVWTDDARFSSALVVLQNQNDLANRREADKALEAL